MLWCSVVLLALCASVQGRAVNISNTWVLPEEGFPVFYRYFRDRISWYEADAVCQFHHANLVTVDTTAQYDAVRAYLKELDISSAVWVGLIRSNPDGDFTWTDYRGLSGDGYWSSAPDARTAPLCAAADPAADYRWEARPCGGPTVASFICELPVPQWALGNEGCMVRALPALTILYLPESAAVQLTADCGLAGVKRVQCTGNLKREELLKELSCTDENESSTPKVPFTGTSWPLTSDTAFTDQDTTNDVTTEENITTEREDNISQSNVIIQSTPIPYKFNSATEYKLPTNDKNKLNKISLERNLFLDDIHHNNLQSNDIPKIANEENYITSEQLDKMEDEKNMQHKMLHEAVARIGNIENIFTQPTDHFVPPLVMAKAKMSDDMTVLSLKEKHAQQIAEQRLSQHNSKHEHMHTDKTTIKESNYITDVPLVLPVPTSKFNNYEKKLKVKSVVPKKYNEKYYDPKNKVLKIFDNKSIKTHKSTEMLSTQSTVKEIETTNVKILQKDLNKDTMEDDPLIDLTVIVKDNPTEIKNKTIITNYVGDVPNLEIMLNDTEKNVDNLTEASTVDSSFQNMYGNMSNVTLTNEIIKITIISDDNSTIHPTILEITTKMPVFTETTTDGNKMNLFSNTTQFIEKADNITVTKKPTAEPASQSSTELERNYTITTPIPLTSTDAISTSSTDFKTTITIHTTSTTDKKTTTEILAASTTSTQTSISNNDKTNTSESTLIMNIPDSTINILNVESQDEFYHNSTDSSEIDDFQSPLLSAASEPLHRPNRSRRPQQPQNRIQFNPFRILG